MVIKPSDHDLVAWPKLPPNRARDGERQRGHVGPEDDLVRSAVKEVRHRGPRPGDHGVGAAAGGVSSASVGIVAAQVIGDGINHALWNLCSAGAVQECGRIPLYIFFQTTKLQPAPPPLKR